MSWRRRFGWVVAGLLLLITAPVLLLYGLLASEIGSRWLLQTATGFAEGVGISVQVGSFKGSFLRDFHLLGVQVRLPGQQIEVDDLRLRWRPQALFDRLLHIEQLAISGLRYQGEPAAEAEPQTQPTAPVLPDLSLPVVLRLDSFSLEGLALQQGDTAFALSRIAFGVNLEDTQWALQEISISGDEFALNGELGYEPVPPHAIQGNLSGWAMAPEIGRVAAAAQLGGQGLLPEVALTLTEPMVVNAEAKADLREATPRFALKARWPRLAWPLRGEPQVESRAGDLSVEGSPEDYLLRLASRVQGPQLPETEVALQGRGSTQGLRLEPLSLQLLEGTLAARGELAWAPTLAWDLMVAADGINPAGLAVDFPGELSARLSSAGELTDAGPVAQVHIESLDGTLRGQPVRASGDVEYRAGRAVAKQLDIASGPNRLILDGEAGKRLALRFDIDAPELAAAYPGLSGALQGRGELSGTQQSPQLVSNLQAKAIAFDTLQIERLDLVARWQASGGSVTLEGTNWRAGGLLFERATAQLAGLPEAHRLTLDAAGPELVLGVTAKGKWLDALWDGTLQRLDLQQSLAGTWQLAAPVRLQAGAELAETQELCLQQAPAQLCLEGGWRAEPRLDLRGKLERLPIERFAALLPEALRVEGQLNGAFSLQGTPASPRAEFSIRPDNGLLRVQTDAEPLEIAYRDVRVDGGFANDQGSAEIGLNLGAAGVAEGRVTLGAAPRRELGGELVARFPDLALISGFVPTLEAVKGKLTADLELDGSLEAPQLEGELRVEEGSARVPDAGLELTDVGLTVRGDGIGPLLIDGGATSGDGRLTLAGKVDLDAEPGPALDLRIRGERFQAVRLPEANVRISPDLTLSGAEPYRLSGVLAIPYALIEVKSLPSSAVSVSSDEFIVGEEGEETTQAGASNLAADVRIQLGDEVTFKGFGLKTRLTGVLDASLDERGQQVYGKIELKDGAYKAFGQDLGIEQGRLLFAGPPASPALDLRAVRVSLDGSVKAYLAVTGPLSKPRTRVYSEPALPDTQALSYLLTGRGTDSAGSEQGLDIAAAAFSLGVDRGEPLLQTMQERLGLDELSVSSGDTGLESSAVTVGKYLNPNLYIGYTQNLFDPAGSVLLRLKLSEQVEVESRAGVQQSVDLFYKIEHD